MWNLIRKTGWAERRKDSRKSAPDLDVSYSSEMTQGKVRVKDISATGLYVLTDERLQPGTDLEVTLQKSCLIEEDDILAPLDDGLQTRVSLRATVVRVGADGAGLGFEQSFTDNATWVNLMEAMANLTGEKDHIRLLRMTKALAFLQYISPASVEGFLHLVANELSQERAGRAIEIALSAGELAAANEGEIRGDVPAEMIASILEDGSKVDEEYTRHLWAELLASSSYKDSNDMMTLNYAVMLSKIDAVQMRIFDAACKLAMRMGWEPGFGFSKDLHCNAEEIKRITHIQNLVGIERDLNHLFELGLVELTDRPTMCQQLERVNMTPTFLGLKLFARCHGQPEPQEAFQGAKLPKAS
jgi:PilZ domain